MSRGHKIKLKVSSRIAGPDEPCDVRGNGAPAVELFIDGKRAELVQRVVVGMDAEQMVPVVFLKLIPGELELELDTDAQLTAALADYSEGFIFGPSGEIRARTAPPPRPPLPPLEPAEAERLADNWRREFGGTAAPPEALAGALGVGAGFVTAGYAGYGAPAPRPERESDRVFREGLLGADGGQKATGGADPELLGGRQAQIMRGFALLDELVSQGAHSEPIVLRVESGRIVKSTLAEYEQKAKNPLPPVS